MYKTLIQTLLAGFYAILAASPLEGGGVMIAARQIAFGGGAKGLSAKDYIQDGLIAMWDGIENVGWGVHEDSSTTWTNLAGGDIADVELTTQNIEWRGDALVGKQREFVDSSTNLSLGSCPMPNEYSTIEAVINPSRDAATWLVFSKGAPLNGAAHLGILNAPRGLQLAYINGSSGGITLANLPIEGRYYVARSGSSSSTEADGYTFLNGEIETSSFSRSNISSVNRFGEGFRTNVNNSFPYIGEICALRFYSRELTAEEIAHNYSIDKARFGL